VLLLALLALGAWGCAAPKAGRMDGKARSEAGGAGQGAGLPCTEHAQCQSGVCDHHKADLGRCAPAPCQAGLKADDHAFYCGADRAWHSTRAEGEACAADLECREPSCFMDPACGTRPRQRAVCREGACRLEPLPGACQGPGLTQVLHPGEYTLDSGGRCQESLEQRQLRTVCVPCGNGACDALESACNCPGDCAAGPR
jgi:hypothetical protein